MKKFLPEDPAKRRIVVRRILLGTGIVVGVATFAVLMRRLEHIDADIEILTEVASDVVDATDAIADAVVIN